MNSLAPVAAVRTPGAEAHIGDVMDAHPEIVEPVEVIVEAALALATCDPATLTGRILYSGPLLDGARSAGPVTRRHGGGRDMKDARILVTGPTGQVALPLSTARWQATTKCGAWPASRTRPPGRSSRRPG